MFIIKWVYLPYTESNKGKNKQNPISKKKEIIKIREEINEIEMKKTVEKFNKTKSWFSEETNKIGKI